MSTSVAIGWLLAAFLITVLLVRGALVYARRRGLFDLPGQRRSHSVPTPRGGGIGVVLALLICIPGALLTLPLPWPAGVAVSLDVALFVVALVGWWDDHRPLPVMPRFGAQLLAVMLFSVFLLQTGLSWCWLPLLLVAGVWCINLHNFMDGIDGLLAQQTIFVGLGLALISHSMAQPALAVGSASLTAAALGFWLYNRPPAQIFMGDVGSGSIGLLIFAFSAILWRVNHAMLWPLLLLSSAFLLDATLTLVMRMLMGKRWHGAHREHLYQWMTRRGGSHRGTDAQYMGWNLFLVGPLTWFSCSHLNMALPVTIAFYLGAAVLWLTLKRRYLRRHLTKDRHVIG